MTSTSANVGATTTLLGGKSTLAANTNTYNVTGTGLGASTVLSGEGIASTYNVSLGVGTIPAGASLTITGHAGGLSVNRDTLALSATGGGRSVGVTYVNAATAASSSIQVAGLGGASPISATSIQQVDYAGGGDAVTVTGPTTAASDITVAPQSATSALVFLALPATEWCRLEWPQLREPRLHLCVHAAGHRRALYRARPGHHRRRERSDHQWRRGHHGQSAYRLWSERNASPGFDDNRRVDALCALAPFGFARTTLPAGPGVIVPGHATNTVFNTITAADTAVAITTTNAVASTSTVLLPITIGSPAPFVQAAPTVTPGLIVDSGDQANSQASGIADNITATFSTNFKIQINGGLPNPIVGSTNGDKLTLATPAGQPINVWNDASTPPNVTINTPTTPDGIGYSSIESLALSPGNGVMNVYGNNNLPSNPQNDYVNVVGTGFKAYSLEVGTSTPPLPSAPANQDLSAPITVTGVTTLNVYGGSSTSAPPFVDSDVNTLNITPWATNVPTGWGIQTNYNQGGATANDLLIWNGLSGISENITVQPSGPLAGQVFATNAAGGNSSIAIVNYTANQDIIVNGTSGAGEVDTLTLDGTSPANGLTSGTDTFTADFAGAATAADPMVGVTDSGPVVPVALYSLQSFSGINTINFDGLGGGDTFDIESFFAAGGIPTGLPKINLDGGQPGLSAATVELAQSASAPTLSAGSGGITFTPSGTTDSGTLTQLSGIAKAVTNTVTFRNAKAVTIVGSVTDTADTLTVNGTGNGDSFVVGPTPVTAPLTAPAGTVQVDGNVPIDFYDYGNSNVAGTNFVTLAGGSGNANFNITPIAGVAVTANGGGLATSNQATVNGTTGTDAINVTPAAANTAAPTTANTTTVVVNALGKVSLTDTANLAINGQGGNDALTVTTPAADSVAYTPGAAVDAGTMAVTGLVPVSFSNLGTAAGTVALVTIAGTATDTLTVNGTSGNDTFATSTAGAGSVQLNSQLPISTAGAASLILNGLGGIDTFNLSLAAAAPTITSILVNGVQTVGADIVNVNDTTAGGNTVAINLQPTTVLGSSVPTITGLGTKIGLAGGDVVNVNPTSVPATADLLNVSGDNNNDALTYTPTGTSAGTIQSANNSSVYNFNNIAGSFTVSGGTGTSNKLIVNGTSGSDAIIVARATATDTVQVGTTKLVNITNAAIPALVIASGTGTDAITVNGSGGPALTVNGGATPASDILTVNFATVNAATTVTPGATPDAGTIVNASDGTTTFTGMVRVVLNAAAGGTTNTLVAQGTTGNDSIALQNLGGNKFWVNSQAPVTFTNYEDVTLASLIGNDTFNVSPVGLVGVTAITVGGAPNSSDALTVNGSAATTAIGVSPTGPNAGTVQVGAVGTNPSVAFTTIEALSINGQSGNATLTVTTPAGANTDTYTPGAAADAGNIQVNTATNGLVPISFSNLGTTGNSVALVNASAGRTDTLNVNGTAGNDVFTVAALTGTVTLNQQLPITTAGVVALTLNGNGGVDTFNVFGTIPYAAGITVNAAGAAGDDPLNVTGPGTNVPIGVGLNSATQVQTITGLGGTINVEGVGTVNINGGGGLNDPLTVTSSTVNSNLNYTPTGTAAGTFQESGIFPVFNFTAITGTFTAVGAATGSNSVTVNGTSNNDTVIVNESPTVAANLLPPRSVTVYDPSVSGTLPLKQVLLDATTIQSVTAQGGFGSDSYLVVPAVGNGSVVGPAFTLPTNLLVNIIGGAVGASSDSLVVANYAPNANGSLATALVASTASPGYSPLATADFAVVNRNSASSGVVRIFQSNGGAGTQPTQFPDIDYTNVGVVQPVVVTNATTKQSQELVLGPDPNQPNNSLDTATYLGSGSTINANNLVIFPNAVEHTFVQADQSYFRVVAQQTGTLDLQVYFTEQAGFLPNNGELQILAYDQNGNVITGFGTNASNSNGQRVRIPVVAGETYYLRVFGLANSGTVGTYDSGSLTVNGYNLSVVNTPAPTPYNLQLNSVVAQATVNAGATAISFSATSLAGAVPLSTVSGFYTGQYLTFVDPTDPGTLGETALITNYVVGVTNTFTLAAPSAASPGLGLTVAPTTGAQFQIQSSDTGRSQTDATTRDTMPTIYLNLGDTTIVAGAAFLQDLTGGGTGSNSGTPAPTNTQILIPFNGSTSATPNGAGYRVAIFDNSNTQSPVPVGYAQPVLTEPGVYSFTFTVANALANGSQNLTAEVQIISPTTTNPPTTTINNGFGAVSAALNLVVDNEAPLVYFGLPTNGFDGLAASSETGSPGVTTSTTPTFYGTAEANAIIKLYAVTTNPAQNGVPVLLGQTVATPTDGTNQDPTGGWTLTSTVSLNNPTYFSTLNGNRTIEVTATDAAGNISAVGTDTTEVILLPPPPQIVAIYIPSAPTFPLFDPKPEAPSPTPLITQLAIQVTTFLPAGTNPLTYEALLASTAQNVSNYTLVGKSGGVIPIESATVTNVGLDANGNPTATVTLQFVAPLKNDVYTLTVSDAITDTAGNGLEADVTALNADGEPIFPTGGGVPSNFVGTFTVNTTAQVGTYAAGVANLDLVGIGSTPFTLAIPGDPLDSMGIHDTVFDGNFFNSVSGTANGFDKLAAYGYDSNIGSFRWLINTTGAGNIITANGDHFTLQPANMQISGLPVAGNFDGNPATGDQVGLFTGTQFYLDTLNQGYISTGSEVVTLPSYMRGAPIVGDFTGNGIPDLATYLNGVFYILLGQHTGAAGTPITYNVNQTPIEIPFAFPGVAAQPVAADMTGDGVDDLGLWVPSPSGSPTSNTGQFYFLTPPAGAALPAASPTQLFDHAFTPVPLGNDQYITFGTNAGLPLAGIWDPPLTTSTGTSVAPAATNLGVVQAPVVTASQDLSGQTWLSTTPARNGNIAVNVGSANGGRVEASLYDSNYNLLATGTVDGNGNLQFSATSTAGQTYFVRLTGLAAGTTGSVSISNVVPEIQRFNVLQQGDTVTPADALAIINYLTQYGPTTLNLTPANIAGNTQIYLDTTMDGSITPESALAVIDYLSLNPAQAAVSPQVAAPETTASDSVVTPQVAVALDNSSGASAASPAIPSPAVTASTVTIPASSGTTIPASAVDAALEAAFQQSAPQPRWV